MQHSLPEALFVCTHNADRSRLAAALLEREAAGRVVVRSAGTDPDERVDQRVQEALHEVGIDANEAFTKPLTHAFCKVFEPY